MELTIQQGDLAFAVGRAFGSVSTKSPMPLLSCLLIEADKNSLRVTGTDLELTTAVTVPCTVKAVGRAAVSARHFNDVVRKIPRGPVTLALADGQVEARYGDGRGWSRFPVQDAAEFPRVPEVKGETKVVIEGDALSRLIARTAYAASTDAARPQLAGVLLHGTDKQIIMVSTDGHRLARAGRKGTFAALGREGIIVPTRALTALSRTAEEATSPVTLEIAGPRNQASFATQVGEYRVQIMVRLLQGPYPNYEQVIPKNNPRHVTLAREDLLEAVDIVASHADNVTRQVRFSIRGEQVGVASATELGAGEHKVSADYQGEDLDIGYNASYLIDMLKTIPTEKVTMRLGTALGAGIIEPVGALTQVDEDLTCLIMPLRLPDAGA
jgi:DNA polymerase-3 subunit beta